ETDPPANDFLGRTCDAWEKASEPAGDFTRRVVLRFGLALAKDGGYFQQLYRPVKFGIMPILGSGEQIVSWIHIGDLARMIRFAIERVEVAGVYNATAPIPVSHSVIMNTIAGKKGGLKIPIPVP